MTPARPPHPISARTFALLAAAAAAFTVYGSLVPFEFQPIPWGQAVERFGRVLAERKPPVSKSDLVSNVLLGVPLGFCLMAALRADRPRSGVEAALAVVAVWPATVLFAAGVEFAQLFFRNRWCAWSDIVAQASGSAVGILVWLLGGPKLTRWVRGVWTSRRVGGTAGRVLLVYLGLLALAELLPLDLTLSPGELYTEKVKPGRVEVVPFGELAGGRVPAWQLVQHGLEQIGLYLLAGMLAAGVPAVNFPRRRAVKVLALGLLLAAALEAGQLLVKSRVTSVTDVFVGGAAVFGGWALVQSLTAGRPGKALSLEAGLILAQAWLFVMVVVYWQPFEIDARLAAPRLRQMNWVPFAVSVEKTSYLSSLEEAVTKALLFAPFGAVVAAVGPFVYRTRRPIWGAALGAAVAALLEAGQLVLPARYPGPTDLIFGAAGGWLGAAAVFRLRCVSPEAVALMQPASDSSGGSIFRPPAVLPDLPDEEPIRVELAADEDAAAR